MARSLCPPCGPLVGARASARRLVEVIEPGAEGEEATGDRHAAGAQTALVALASNAAIAIAKLGAFVLTGSASMLAETVHSAADTANEGLLLLGNRRGGQEADRVHPFGYARLRYFWAFVVSVVLFTVGGVVSLLEGVDKLRHPHPAGGLWWAVAVLVAGMVLESVSFVNAIRKSNPLRAQRSWPRFVAEARQPELPVVLLEDFAALIGLSAALVGVVAARMTGRPEWDAAGSVVIGVLLMVVALVLGREMKGMLVGESAPDATVALIRRSIGECRGVVAVRDLRTEQLGPDTLLLGATVIVASQLSVPEVIATLDRARRRLQESLPEARFVFLEPCLPSEP
ncbi:MAG: cation diffusion facilitator family transporter [Actinomycetota bacterium]|nr:cation diffusion facilitator family transporter [Actinomycetota bacterium]